MTAASRSSRGNRPRRVRPARHALNVLLGTGTTRTRCCRGRRFLPLARRLLSQPWRAHSATSPSEHGGGQRASEWVARSARSEAHQPARAIRAEGRWVPPRRPRIRRASRPGRASPGRSALRNPSRWPRRCSARRRGEPSGTPTRSETVVSPALPRGEVRAPGPAVGLAPVRPKPTAAIEYAAGPPSRASVAMPAITAGMRRCSARPRRATSGIEKAAIAPPAVGGQADLAARARLRWLRRRASPAGLPAISARRPRPVRPAPGRRSASPPDRAASG
jgi:hypothetical protein